MSAVSTPAPLRHEPTSRPEVDAALATLTGRSAAWAALTLDDRIEYLRSLLRGMWAAAPGLIADACAAKGISGAQAGEEWVAAVVPQLRTVRILIDTLEGIRRTGRVPLPASAIRTRPDGQVTVRVMPTNFYDRVLYAGVTADVWVEPEVRRADLDRHLGSFYTKGATPEPGVSLVLGGGNVNAIAPLDVVHKMFVEGSTALLKVARINEYTGPHIERAFADLIADGFFRTVYGGGADVGEYACQHRFVDRIHLTGADRTHDALVWGSGPEGEARRAEGRPRLAKRVTSELGNVGPVIIVPGKWSERALRLRAEDVATQIAHNAGFNCNASRVVVMAEGWAQREAFLAHLRRVLRSLPPRPAFYPGSEETYDRFLAAHDGGEVLGTRRPGMVPPALLVGLDPAGDHLVFREEPWCYLAATTSLPASTAAEFLERAVGFCNERLSGTLSATLLVDGQTARELGSALEEGLGALRAGTVGVNIWSAAGFVFGSTTWGAYPGHTLEDIGSGIGVVHNARLVDRPQKTVIRAPFGLFPKPPWFVTHRHADRALVRVAALEVDPHWWRVPGIAFWTALG